MPFSFVTNGLAKSLYDSEMDFHEFRISKVLFHFSAAHSASLGVDDDVSFCHGRFPLADC